MEICGCLWGASGFRCSLLWITRLEYEDEESFNLKKQQEQTKQSTGPNQQNIKADETNEGDEGEYEYEYEYEEGEEGEYEYEYEEEESEPASKLPPPKQQPPQQQKQQPKNSTASNIW